jgi:pimeloyl-ACP methyl ester carboxylesterase
MHYLPYVAAGIQALVPEFRPEEVLTPKAMQHFARATTGGCWFYGYSLYEDMPKATSLKSGWSANPSVQRYIKESEEGVVRIDKPLLVISGEADLTIPIEGVRQIVARACRNGTSVTFRSYPGLGLQCGFPC